MCVLLRSVFPERTRSSGAGGASAFFHRGFIFDCVIKVPWGNPADLDIKAIKRRYWFDFQAPGLDFGT